MNKLQTKIFNVINAIIRIDDFNEYYDDHTIRYGVLNYVAKFSLSKDKYLITKKAYRHLLSNNFLNTKGLRRGLKSRKNGFTYEHPIPSNRISAEIIKYRHDENMVVKILNWTDYIVVLTTEENNSIKDSGFQNNMPENWTFFKDNIFERYKFSPLVEDSPSQEISVYGQICR
tara:strand:- start:523 stop:1041 length:519 start_codon:yes stop_codon:yes gene_type:complete